MKWKLNGAARWTLAAMVALTAWGCSGKTTGVLVGNERPQVQLTARPQPGDSVYFKVRLQWTASDGDGKVEYFKYNVDPPLSGDTTWTRIDRNETTIFFKSSTPREGDVTLGSNGQFPAFAVSSRDYHEFVIKAVDNEGAESPPTSVSFTSRTVAPVTQILSPVNGRGVTRSTAPSVRIEWRGVDADREGEGQAGPPRMYKYKLVTQTQIQQAEHLGSTSPSAENIQHFFTTDGGPPAFANWDSVSSDTTFKQYEALTPGQIWFFAVVAFDIAGAYEPRFNLDNNVLRFKPSTELQAPSIVVFNSFFIRSQGNKGYFDLSESRVVRIQVPEGEPIPFNWDAAPATGTLLAGFRWVLDPIDGDIFNEAARENDTQTYRWSSWSTSEQSATLGPFYQVTTVGGQSDTTVFHRFYIEARDNTGAISIMIIEIEVVRAVFKDPTQARNILFFDDFRALPDRPDHQPFANFPIESALDTLMYAVGGFPYQFRPGQFSNPGVFAGYFSDESGKVVSDTADYRFIPTTGLPLSVMARYKAVVWYTDAKDAGLTGSKNGSTPECALRFANDFGQLNGLAVYLSQGGKCFLFGSGSVISIANGYVTRFGNTNPAPPPYASPTGNTPDRTHILWPGNFMYDYMFIRSQMDIADQAGAGNGTGSDTDNYLDFIPYLPQFQCPGAPWPPDGWTGQRTPTCDPRVGPASAANAAVWDGLPQLHMQTEFNTWPTRPPQSIVCYYVSNPNIITPDVGELDTLYLGRAKVQLIRGARDNPDGKPVWFHCTGKTGWEINWTNIPLWYVDRTELRGAVDKILGKWGFHRNSNPLTQTGPGGVELTASEKMGSENP